MSVSVNLPETPEQFAAQTPSILQRKLKEKNARAD
jgi:hypothetical protein